MKNEDKLSLLSFVLLLIVVFTIPIFQYLTPIFIVFFTLSTLVNGIVYVGFSMVNKKVFITGILFYMIHVISYLYSEDKVEALFDLEVKLSFFVFPIVFLVKNRFILTYTKYIYLIFIISVIIANFYTLFLSLEHYHYQVLRAFSNARWYGFMHPSYLSMYSVFAIVLSYFFIIEFKSRWIKTTLSFVLLFLTAMVFSIQSKTGMFTLFIVIIYLSIISLKRVSSIYIKILAPLLLSTILILLITSNNRVLVMYQTIKGGLVENIIEGRSTSERFDIWEVSFNIISNNLLFGVGSGDIQKELDVEYNKNKNKFSHAIKFNLNPHNQFIETLLGQGLLGLVLLLMLSYFGFYSAIHNKDFILMAFMLLLIMNLISESMFNRQAGVVFISLFYYLLTFKNKEIKNIYED